MTHATRALATAAAIAAALLAGCAADRPKPTPLENFAPRMSARVVPGPLRRATVASRVRRLPSPSTTRA